MNMSIRKAINLLMKYPATDIYLTNGTKIIISDIRYINPNTDLSNLKSKVKTIDGNLVFRKIDVYIHVNGKTDLTDVRPYLDHVWEGEGAFGCIPERNMNSFISNNGGIDIKTFELADYFASSRFY